MAWVEQQKLIDTGLGSFGWSVSIDGDTAVVGAYHESYGAFSNAGTVSVYIRVGGAWTLQQQLFPSDPSSWKYFGYEVSIDGDTIVAGAYRDGTEGVANAGAAYVFTRTAGVWTEEQKLIASDIGTANDYFGFAVGVSGDTVVVTAEHRDSWKGAAYVYTRTAGVWTEQQILTPAIQLDWQPFGESVAIDGDSIIVGTTAAYDAAYVFTRSGGVWTEQQKLTVASSQWFGHFVAIDGDNVVVADNIANTVLGNASGAAYVFTRSEGVWTEQQQLLASDGTANDYFGRSVAIDGNTVIVGASWHTVLGVILVGASYVFTRSEGVWTEQQQLLASDGASGDYFGSSADLEGDTYITGAFGGGAAYISYDEPPPVPPPPTPPTPPTTEPILGHRFTVSSVQTIGVPQVIHQWNQFDEHASMVSLHRKKAEKNWELARRTRDAMVNLANSSYRGLVNGITRKLGLSLFKAVCITPKTGHNTEYLAADPYILFDGPSLYLYNDYANGELEYQIDRFEPGGNYEFLRPLIDFINTSTYFTASLWPGVDEYTRSMTILNQSNRESIFRERVPKSTRFRLRHARLISNTVFFSDRDLFRTEVSFLDLVNTKGNYHIDYSKGIVTVYTVPSENVTVRYQYVVEPFCAWASPVILHDLNGAFKTKLFQQVLQEDGGYINGVPSELGVDIINEIFSVIPMYWGT